MAESSHGTPHASREPGVAQQSSGPEPKPGQRSGRWQAFARTHLHDYGSRARRLWLAVVVLGAVVGAGALLWLAQHWAAGSAEGPMLMLGLSLPIIAVLAAFPVRIPRTKYVYPAADIFVFALLALLGPAAAVVATGVEAAVATVRQSRRVSSWLSAPAFAMLGMAAAGLVHTGLLWLLPAIGVQPGLTAWLALSAAALAYFAGSSLPVVALMAAKADRPVSLAHWIGTYGWTGAVFLVSAWVAALLAPHVSAGGVAVFAAAGALALVLLGLVNLSVAHHEREHAAQDARIRQAREEAEANQRRFLAAFTHAAIGMAIARPDGCVHQVNAALLALLGRQEADLVGRPFQELLHVEDVPAFARQERALRGGAEAPPAIELRCLHADGGERWVSLHLGRFDDPGNGTAAGTIYQLHDVTSRRHAEARLQHIAYHDGLTDLANRNRFIERLHELVERSRLDGVTLFAVLFLDLDRFKVVNDSLGHAAGNELLCEVARRLQRSVRSRDLVARLGGDEFAILLCSLSDAEQARWLAHRVLESLSRPMQIEGTEVLPAASIGLTISDLGYRTADEILRDADLAMYEAKTSGTGVALFDQSMLDRVAQRLALESELRQAIAAGQLELHYQPICALGAQGPTGLEALVRWNHPVRGPLSPALFVPLAEEAGIIGAMTEWVLDEAVRQLAHWRRTIPGLQELSVQVNVSGRDLSGEKLLPQVQRALERHELPPHLLGLEITETTLMARIQDSMRTLNALRAAGVRVAIDDFGTGYSSLAYLSTLPIDTMKIDRSFVAGMGERAQNMEIVRAVVTLGRALGSKIVAEGIETAEQLQALRALGVSHGQGYLLSRPVPAAQVPALLATLGGGQVSA